MKTAIALVHGHAAKWLQVIIQTLKQFKTDREFDIFVANSWPGHPSIKALTETSLGEGVTVIDCTIRLHSHATGLEQILDYITDKDEYDYMFTGETDCMVCRTGWLDWFHDQIHTSQGRACMAGFFWHEGNNHYNVNSSGTLYRKDMLLKYHKEARNNNEGMFWHPNGNRHDSEEGMDPTIKDLVGCFAETRGIKDPTPIQKEQILAGVPQASWFEPGAWLYYKSLGEYTHVRVPCDHIYKKFGPVTSPEGTYYGGKENPYYIHAWGGTRCYDFLKHPITDGFVSGGAPYWLKREDEIWKNLVPEDIRAIMPSLYEEMEFEKKIRENLPSIGVVERLGLVAPR